MRLPQSPFLSLSFGLSVCMPACLSPARKPQRASIYAYLIEFLLLFAVLQSQRQSKPSFLSLVGILIEYLYDVVAHLQSNRKAACEVQAAIAPAVCKTLR